MLLTVVQASRDTYKCLYHQQLRAGCVLQDKVLSDEELNAFQTRCFAAPLQAHELSGIKTVVARKLPQVRSPETMQSPQSCSGQCCD